MTELYFSVDVESDGPLPGPNSMLSYGAAAFTAEGTLVGTFTENLELLPGAKGDPGTMEWWSKPEQAQAWKACRENLQDPKASTERFTAWIRDLSTQHKAKPVYVAYPAGYDFMFSYTYFILFTGSSPFSFSALDIKTFAMATMGTEYRESTKRNMPKSWIPAARHTHVAIDDAIEQGLLFINILKASLKQPKGLERKGPRLQ